MKITVAVPLSELAEMGLNQHELKDLVLERLDLTTGSNPVELCGFSVLVLIAAEPT